MEKIELKDGVTLEIENFGGGMVLIRERDKDGRNPNTIHINSIQASKEFIEKFKKEALEK